MTSKDIDNYLAGLEEPKCLTPETVRRSIVAAVPQAEEGLGYGGAGVQGPRKT